MTDTPAPYRRGLEVEKEFIKGLEKLGCSVHRDDTLDLNYATDLMLVKINGIHSVAPLMIQVTTRPGDAHKMHEFMRRSEGATHGKLRFAYVELPTTLEKGIVEIARAAFIGFLHNLAFKDVKFIGIRISNSEKYHFFFLEKFMLLKATSMIKGFVEQYREDQGIGFIRGNDGVAYFFHVNDATPDLREYLVHHYSPKDKTGVIIQGLYYNEGKTHAGVKKVFLESEETEVLPVYDNDP